MYPTAGNSLVPYTNSAGTREVNVPSYPTASGAVTSPDNFLPTFQSPFCGVGQTNIDGPGLESPQEVIETSKWRIPDEYLSGLGSFLKSFNQNIYPRKKIAYTCKKFASNVVKHGPKANQYIKLALRKSVTAINEECLSALVVSDFKESDFNRFLEAAIEEKVSKILTPLNMELGDMSFYASVSKVVFGFSDGAHLIRGLAVQHLLSQDYTSRPNRIVRQENMHAMLCNLNLPNQPLNAVINAVSELMIMDIYVVCFDVNGRVESTQRFASLPGPNPNCIFLGTINSDFFPFAPKQNLESSDILRDLESFLVKPVYYSLFQNEASERQKPNSELNLQQSKLKPSEKPDEAVPPPKLYSFPVHKYTETCYYHQQNPSQPVKYINQVEKIFVTCGKDCRITHYCSAIKLAWQEWKVLKGLFETPKFGNFTMKDVEIANSAGSTIQIEEFYNTPFPSTLQSIFCPIQVPKDGNCAYAAISVCLTLDNAYAKCLRRACCLECIYEPEVNDFYQSMPIERVGELVRVIRQDNTWINEYGLWVLSAVVSREIQVFQHKIGNDDEYSATTYGRWRSSSDRPPLCIFQQRLENVTHYVALIRKNEDVELPNVTYVLPDFRKYEASIPNNRKNWPDDIKPLPMRLQGVKHKTEKTQKEDSADKIKNREPNNEQEELLSPTLSELLAKHQDVHSQNKEANPNILEENTPPFVEPENVTSLKTGAKFGANERFHEHTTTEASNRKLFDVTAGYVPTVQDDGSLNRRFGVSKRIHYFSEPGNAIKSTSILQQQQQHSQHGLDAAYMEHNISVQRSQINVRGRKMAGKFGQDHLRAFREVAKEQLLRTIGDMKSLVQNLFKSSSWVSNTQKAYGQKKTRTDLRKLGTFLYMRQRKRQGRQIVVDILYKAKVNKEVIDYYLQQADNNFGKLPNKSCQTLTTGEKGVNLALGKQYHATILLPGTLGQENFCTSHLESGNDTQDPAIQISKAEEKSTPEILSGNLIKLKGEISTFESAKQTQKTHENTNTQPGIPTSPASSSSSAYPIPLPMSMRNKNVVLEDEVKLDGNTEINAESECQISDVVITSDSDSNSGIYIPKTPKRAEILKKEKQDLDKDYVPSDSESWHSSDSGFGLHKKAKVKGLPTFPRTAAEINRKTPNQQNIRKDKFAENQASVPKQKTPQGQPKKSSNSSDSDDSATKKNPAKSSSSSPTLNINGARNARKLREIGLSKETLASVLRVTSDDLAYAPQPRLSGIIKAADIHPTQSINYATGKFITKKYGGNYPSLVNAAMKAAGSVCAFHSSGSPNYYSQKLQKHKIKGWCSMRGHCGKKCEMKFDVVVPERPKEGKDIKIEIFPYGVFHLIQSKSTGRQIRNVDRERVKALLKNTNAHAVFVENFSHLTGLRNIHRNHPFQSNQTIRKIKSEINTGQRLDQNPDEDLYMLEQQYITETVNAVKVKGYIQFKNTVAEKFRISLYDEASLCFHVDQLRRGLVTCYIDATGGVVRKIDTPKPQVDKTDGKKTSNKPLFYNLLAKNWQGVTYPIGQQISVRGRELEISTFLKELITDLRDIKPALQNPLGHVIVMDWSFAIIKGVLSGVNVQELDEYLNECWDVLNGKKRWKKGRSVPFICTSHLVKATERLLASKLGTLNKRENQLLHLALEATARLQESFNMYEFDETCRAIIRVFGEPKCNLNAQKQDLAFIQSRKSPIEITIKNEPDPEEVNLIDWENEPKLLREKSKFYQRFIQHQNEIKRGNALNPTMVTTDNIYYHPQILKTICEQKIPYWPLWSSAVARISNQLTSSFLRESNATVESSFHRIKNLFGNSKHQLYTDFIRKLRTFHLGSLKIATDEIIKSGGKLPDPPKKKGQTQQGNEEESWKNTKPGSSFPGHFTPKSPFASKREKHPNINQENLIQTEEFDTRRIPCEMETSADMTEIGKHDNTTGKNSEVRTSAVKLNKGLPNLGNTCFLNSAMQALLSLPFISHDMLPEPLQIFHAAIFGLENEHNIRQLASSGKTKLDQMLKSGENPLTANIFDARQQDVFELLQNTLAHDDCKSLRMQFESYPVRTITCLNPNCGQMRPTNIAPEIFYRVETSLPLQEALEKEWNFQKHLDCKCNVCSATEMLETTIMYEPPNCLLVVTELWNQDLRKISLPEQYQPLQFSTKLPFVDGSVSYRLQSYITHTGTEMAAGHYTAYIRRQDHWIVCNDSKVYTIQEHVLGEDETIYVYFFVKV